MEYITPVIRKLYLFSHFGGAEMFKPLSWLFSFCGIMPRHNKFDKYVTATALSIIFLTMVYAIPYWYNEATFSLKWKILFASYTMSMVSTIFHIIQAYYRRQFFKTLTSRIALLGRRLLVETSKYRNFEVALFSTYSLMATAQIITLLLKTNNARASAMRTISYSFTLAPLMQQLILMYQLDCCFYELNNQLQVIVKKSQNTSLGMLRADLRAMFIAHVDLRQFIADLNSYFASVNLLSILSRLFNTICTMYSILISISDNKVDTLIYTAQVVISFAIVVATAELGYRCSEKAKETVLIAHRMLNLQSPIELMDDVEEFSLTMFNNPVCFTAAGVFNLNRAFITKATAAALSYLIVAVQLKDVDLSASHNNTLTATTVNDVTTTPF